MLLRRKIAFILLAILLVSLSSVSYNMASSVTISARESLYHDGFESSYYTLSNGYNAFCMEFEYAHPNTGHTISEIRTYTTDYTSMPYKILYYGWGGPEQWSGFAGDINIGVPATGVTLSYETTGIPDYVFQSDEFKAFYDYVKEAPTPPSNSISFSPNNPKASMKDNVQKTELITFQADNRLSVTMTLDSDLILYKEGSSTPYKNNVTLTGGDKFYITAPLSRTSDFSTNVTYSGNKIFTVMQAIPLYADQGYQKMAYRANQNISTELSIDFETIKGVIQINKASSNKKITDNNNCYDLSGVTYGVYLSKEAALAATEKQENAIATITTDSNGFGESPELPYGTYYIKEAKSSKNYILSNTICEATTFDVIKTTNNPVLDPISLLIHKTDEDGKGLNNAEFLVNYYDIQLNNNDEKINSTPKKTWTLKSDKDGNVFLQDDYKVSGDEFYTNELGQPVLPMGTITIQETKAPDGYILDDKIYVQSIKENQTTNENGYFYNTLELSNQSIPKPPTTEEPPITTEAPPTTETPPTTKTPPTTETPPELPPDVPKTGDTFNIIFLIFSIILSVFGICLTYFKLKSNI